MIAVSLGSRIRELKGDRVASEASRLRLGETGSQHDRTWLTIIKCDVAGRSIAMAQHEAEDAERDGGVSPPELRRDAAATRVFFTASE